MIKGILHNGFRDLITKNDKPIASLYAARQIENLLGSMAPSLFGTAAPDLIRAAEDASNRDWCSGGAQGGEAHRT